jgi:hypothetical protein
MGVIEMDATGKVVRLFEELIAEGEAIKRSCKKLYFSGQKKDISPERFIGWKTKCLSLLKSTFGSSSPQYDSFVSDKFFDYYNATQVFLGILKAAVEDLQKGYFFHKDLMLSVNIYDSLLSRARRYIENDQLRKAEAVLEAVLHEALSKICTNKKIPSVQEDTIQTLAETLYKAETIPETVKERLVGLQQQVFLSSSSADELTAATEWVLSFLNKYLGGQILILN